MAKVPLRVYLREIEEAIEQKQPDEAIAHCRHILKTYPKSIDTYRLLGQAYLENQRYSNAADIFQRVLSAVPDDFVSHVGMSIIREDEGNLDAAIWHMERAFESQPYNAAIQAELQRLYGRRDGMEPPKVNLTRGALARMYAKGNLYQQAIAELRAALAEDPGRPDLQIVLARMYVQQGDQNEAIQACSTLLNKLPFCQEANRLLVEILPETERAGDTDIYKQRLQALDPYETFISPNAPTADQVPDQAVSLERLIWDGGPTVGIIDQPEWAASVGANLGDSEAAHEELPEWLDSSSEEPSTPWKSEPIEPAEPTPENQIPGWMKEAGWGPDTGEFDESKPAFEFENEAAEAELSEAVAGEVPDWLQEITSEGAIQEPEPIIPTEPEEDTGLPDWLEESPPDGASDTIITWLDEKGSVEPTAEPVSQETPAKSFPDWVDEDAVPEWLADTGKETPAAESALGEIPDWLKDIKVETPAEEAETFASGDGADLPDWLDKGAISAGEAVAASAVTQPESKTLEPSADEAEAGDIPDWLSGIEEHEEPEAESGELPGWMKDIEEQPLSEAAPVEEEVVEEPGELPSWMSEIEEESPVSEVSIEEPTMPAGKARLPDWLSELEEEESEAIPGEIPDWLKEVSEQAPITEAPQEVAAFDAATPEEEAETEPGELPDWLSKLEEEESEAIPGEIPDWLKEVSEQAPITEAPQEMAAFDAATPEEEVEAEPGELPDWLSEMEEEGPEAIPGEIPEWISEIGEEIPTESVEEIEQDKGLPEWTEEAGVAATVPLSQPEGLEFQESVEEIPFSDEAAPDLTDTDAAIAWLEGLAAKQGVPEEELLTSPEERSEEIPEWIRASASSEAEATAKLETIEEVTEAVPSEIPDWLQEMAEKAPEIEEQIEPVRLGEEITEDELPEWLSETGEMEPVPSPVEEMPEYEDEEIPDWLKEIDARVPATAGEEEVTASQPVTIKPQIEEEIPDWLQDISDLPVEEHEEMVESVATTEAETAPSVEFENADAALAWLESLAAKQDISEEELLTTPEQRSEAPPEWVRAEEEAEPAVQEVESEAELVSEIPEWLGEPYAAQTEEVIEAAPEAEIPEAEQAEEFPEWLAEPAISESEEPPTELFAEPEGEAEEVAIEPGAEFPEWLTEPVAEAETRIEEREIEPVAETTPIEEPEIETGIDFDDADAAMAWLESLAAKQGVSEEELLSTPDERSETPPEWVRAEAEADLEPITEEQPLDIEEIPSWEQETIQTTPVQIPEDELPEWLQTVMGEKPVEEQIPEILPEAPATAEFEPWMQKAPITEEEAVTPADETRIHEDEAEPEFMEPTPIPVEELAPREEIPAPEEAIAPPDWVVEGVEPDETGYEWLPSEAVSGLETPSVELIDLNTASLIQLERLAGVGFRRAQAIVTYRDEYGNFASLDELQNVPGLDAETIDLLKTLLKVEVLEAVEPESKPGTGALPSPLVKVEPEDEYHAQQLAAQDKFRMGDIESGLADYAKLIKKGKRLNEVIDDLNHALYNVPTDVSVNVLQTLGDAYMKADKLQDAIDAYTKAEEFLR
jgi:competence ComEA-like helix-hairpin-helix protein